jgi:hypothetical protein
MRFNKFELLIQDLFIDDALKPYNCSISCKREQAQGPFLGYAIGICVKLSKLLFLYEEPGGAGVMIGNSRSNFENIDNRWFDLDRIISYVSDQPFNWEDPYTGMSYDDRISAIFTATANSFSPVAEQVIEMFNNNAKELEWESDYKKYKERQIKLRYPEFFE